MSLSDLAGLYSVLSVIAFALYALDKSAARNRNWRIPENLLHLLALLGGWPGAWIAQTALRHKTRKRSFLIVFWLTALLNICFTGWFMIR